jgi:hypothetical protein
MTALEEQAWWQSSHLWLMDVGSPVLAAQGLAVERRLSA